MDQNEIEHIVNKAQQLDADDKLRRGILEYVAQWFDAQQESRRRRIEREIEKRARRLAY